MTLLKQNSAIPNRWRSVRLFGQRTNDDADAPWAIRLRQRRDRCTCDRSHWCPCGATDVLADLINEQDIDVLERQARQVSVRDLQVLDFFLLELAGCTPRMNAVSS